MSSPRVITPTFSVCTRHGYLSGEHPTCPRCADEGYGEVVCEVWTRVMGYHRPVSSFNIGKKGEHAERVHFVEAPAKDPGFLARVGGDGHGGARRPRPHGIGEAESCPARSRLEVEAPTRTRVVGIGGAPAERVGLVVGAATAGSRGRPR